MTTDTLITLSQNEKLTYLKSLTYILNLSKKGGSKKESRKKLFLECHMHELGIPLSELQSIKNNKAESIINELKQIPNIKIKKYMLREMILLAIADHELSDGEISAIYQIGARAGIKEEAISDFFLWAAKGVEWQIEGLKLVEENI
ncbi:MAG: hypothetical protein LBR70_05720 [Lactobacillaceae bacterium]|jgi:hypothetical protein|nr:hypothetical protein [Lactobacillaceae bacterium]